MVQADKFRVCQKLQSYLKTLGYYADISFNSFLFPNVKDTRKILAFLFEIMFKDDKNEDDEEARKPNNSYEVAFKRRLTQFKEKPWVLPDFLEVYRPLAIGGGERIIVSKGLDAVRVAD